MATQMVIELDAPDELARFELPTGVHQRLQCLLDRQDRDESLAPEERQEAEGLVDLAELLSLLRTRGRPR